MSTAPPTRPVGPRPSVPPARTHAPLGHRTTAGGHHSFGLDHFGAPRQLSCKRSTAALSAIVAAQLFKISTSSHDGHYRTIPEELLGRGRPWCCSHSDSPRCRLSARCPCRTGMATLHRPPPQNRRWVEGGLGVLAIAAVPVAAPFAAVSLLNRRDILGPPSPAEPDLQISRIRLPNLSRVRPLKLRPWAAAGPRVTGTTACWHTIAMCVCPVGCVGRALPAKSVGPLCASAAAWVLTSGLAVRVGW